MKHYVINDVEIDLIHTLAVRVATEQPIDREEMGEISRALFQMRESCLRAPLPENAQRLVSASDADKDPRINTFCISLDPRGAAAEWVMKNTSRYEYDGSKTSFRTGRVFRRLEDGKEGPTVLDVAPSGAEEVNDHSMGLVVSVLLTALRDSVKMKRGDS